MVLNPIFNFKAAPKENNFHCIFDKNEAFDFYIILKNSNTIDLEEDYLKVKDYLEDKSLDNFEDDFETLFEELKNTFNNIIFCEKSNYYVYYNYNSKGFGDEYNLLLFGVGKKEESFFSGGELSLRDNFYCSNFESLFLKLHIDILSEAGTLKSNDKSIILNWEENENDYNYDVSFWKDKKLIDIYNTDSKELNLNKYSNYTNNGSFEIIVVSKTKNGFTSVPSVYRLIIKTSIDHDDIYIRLIDEDDNQIDTAVLSNPSFKIFNYNESYIYTLNFDNKYFYSSNDPIYSSLFVFDSVSNSLIFTYPNHLDEGSHSVNLLVKDEFGNKFGGDYLSPKSVYGTNYLFFNVSTSSFDNVKILEQKWLNDTDLLLSWKATDLTRDFRIFQSNEMLLSTVNSYCVIQPKKETTKDTVLTIVSYSNDSKATTSSTYVIVDRPMVKVEKFVINSKDTFDLNGSIYCNNVNPTFNWSILTDLSNIKYFKVSLDGSNWIDVYSSSYTFKNLRDGNYLLRIKVVFQDNKVGENNYYNFIIKTDLPSSPVFNQNTLNSFDFTKEKFNIGWIDSLKIKKYIYSFNDRFFDNSYETNENTISNVETLSYGLNTIYLKSLDIYGNESEVSSFTFNLSKTVENITEDFVLTSTDNTNRYFSFDVSSYLNENELYTYVIFDPYDKVYEKFEDTYMNIFGNTKKFYYNGKYTFKIFKNDIEVINPVFYDFNLFSFKFLNVEKNGNEFVWSTTKDQKGSYFSYSIVRDGTSSVFNDTYSKSVTINTLPDGNYTFILKGFSSDNVLQDYVEYKFIYKNDNVFDIKMIPVYNTNYYLYCFFYKKSSDFIIKAIKDINGNDINCFLQYKKNNENVYKLYNFNNKIILDKEEKYNFIFNEII